MENSKGAPLLLSVADGADVERAEGRPTSLAQRFYDESRKLWAISGPALLQRLAIFTMISVPSIFAGHLGDSELAALSISYIAISGLNFGFLLGLASALETLCGQAFGAKRYGMLGVYLQRSWIVELAFATLLLPTYLFTEQLLRAVGQSEELAVAAGRVAVWLIPQHFAMALQFPIVRFLQSQRRNWITAVTAFGTLAFQVGATWLLVIVLGLSVGGAVLGAGLAWWLLVIGQVCFVVGGGCPETWEGLSAAAFDDLWEFVKLSTASGVMLCLEFWYYRILVLATGYLSNAEIAVDALSICMNINGWEMMIPLSFFAGVGVRVANELGAGDGSGAKFAAVVATATSVLVGVFVSAVIVVFDHNIAMLFTTSKPVLDGVHHLSVLLGITILLNSVQPVLSGVAVGSGWQTLVAYVNVGSYYFIGVPAGVFLGWAMKLGVSGIWAGMIGGTTIQTLAVAYITVRRDWDEEVKVARARAHRW